MGPKELPVVREEEDEEEEEEMETVVVEAPEEKWDCETIISEFSHHAVCFLSWTKGFEFFSQLFPSPESLNICNHISWSSISFKFFLLVICHIMDRLFFQLF